MKKPIHKDNEKDLEEDIKKIMRGQSTGTAKKVNLFGKTKEEVELRLLKHMGARGVRVK